MARRKFNHVSSAYDRIMKTWSHLGIVKYPSAALNTGVFGSDGLCYVMLETKGTEPPGFINDSTPAQGFTLVNLPRGAASTTGFLQMPCLEKMAAASLLQTHIENFAVLGNGMGSLQDYLYHLCPSAKGVGIEINTAVERLRRARIKNHPKHKVITGSAFDWLKSKPRAGVKYNLIAVDAFLGVGDDDFDPSWAFLDTAKRLEHKLTADGIVVVNLQGYERKFNRAIYQKFFDSMHEVGFQAAILGLDEWKNDNPIGVFSKGAIKHRLSRGKWRQRIFHSPSSKAENSLRHLTDISITILEFRELPPVK